MPALYLWAPRAAAQWPWSQKHKYFSDICEETGGSAIIHPTPGLCFQKISIFCYSNVGNSAVLKLTSAVIAMALVRLLGFLSLFSLGFQFSCFSCRLTFLLIRFFYHQITFCRGPETGKARTCCFQKKIEHHRSS